MTTVFRQMDFNLTRKDLGTLVLRANFVPGGLYTISVSSSEDIRDGFGLPLEASTAIWKGGRLPPDFKPISEGLYSPE